MFNRCILPPVKIRDRYAVSGVVENRVMVRSQNGETTVFEGVMADGIPIRLVEIDEARIRKRIIRYHCMVVLPYLQTVLPCEGVITDDTISATCGEILGFIITKHILGDSTIVRIQQPHATMQIREFIFREGRIITDRVNAHVRVLEDIFRNNDMRCIGKDPPVREICLGTLDGESLYHHVICVDGNDRLVFISADDR